MNYGMQPYDHQQSGPWGAPAPADGDTASDRSRRWHPAGQRSHGRRFGVAALGATLAVGAGAGALATGLVAASSGTTVVGTAAQTTAATRSTQAVVAKVEPALVDIHTTGTRSSSYSFNPFGTQTTTAAAGTGMIIRSDGLVLTNAHVLEGATSISVTLDGQTTSHPATLVGEDAAKDIALIRVQGVSNLPTVTLANSSAVQSGDPVLAIGNALDLQNGGFTASSGIVSGLDRTISTDNGEHLTGLIQTDAPISSGDSGGALVNAAGEVIGMNTASASSSGTNTAANIGFAIPTSTIESEIGTLEHGNIGTPTTGAGGATTPNPGSGAGNPGGGSGFGYPTF